MSGECLRAVIVGGHIGRSHAKAYLESDRTDLVAVCDIDPMTLDAFGDEFDVEGRYTDYETMLREEQPDLISIGTPQQLHTAATACHDDHTCGHALFATGHYLRKAHGE